MWLSSRFGVSFGTFMWLMKISRCALITLDSRQQPWAEMPQPSQSSRKYWGNDERLRKCHAALGKCVRKCSNYWLQQHDKEIENYKFREFWDFENPDSQQVNYAPGAGNDTLCVLFGMLHQISMKNIANVILSCVFSLFSEASMIRELPALTWSFVDFLNHNLKISALWKHINRKVRHRGRNLTCQHYSAAEETNWDRRRRNLILRGLWDWYTAQRDRA